MNEITYQNKVALNENPEIADINKVKASDMNEIKSVVNTNSQTSSNNFGLGTDTWTSGGTYSIGDIVVYNDNTYKNLTGTNTATTPDQDSTNWEVIPLIVNEYNTSTKNTYSCDYVNKAIDPNIITVNIPDINPISFTAYENQNITSGYTLNNSVGSKLTLNNGIKIGTGISKVKVSAMAKFYNGDDGNNVYMLFINKNGSGENNTYSIIRAYDFGTESLPTLLISVQENDIITVGVSCSKTLSNVSRLFTGYLTVEVVK